MTYRLPTRLTLKELQPIMGFYHAKFPTWRVVREDTLIREAGPVAQGITFERLSSGDYRPTGHIRVLVAPGEFWFLELSQNLSKPRQINRRQHPEFRDRVVEAIRAEFMPSVDRPLVVEEVLELYEHEANPPRSPDAYSLAPLNAYLGHDERAMHWCSRFTQLVNEVGNPWQDFDYKRRAFLDQLEQWLQAGEAKQQLERVLQEERRKWGLV
jgi:hypothetical protein